MPATKRKSSSKAKRAPARRKTPKKAAPRSRGIQPEDCRIDELPPEAAEVAKRVEQEGGAIVGRYYEPLGRNPLLLAALPIDSVEPTPFQRDLSDAHHKKLSEVIDRTGLFLDPVIAITAPGQGFWTPNGRHRLEALRRLGAKSIIALVVPKREIAWQILALNTEKAHNLRERSLEVIRIYKGLLEEDASRAEKDFSFYLEDPALVTLGLCYERKGNFAGGAYHSILRRLMEFSTDPIRKAIAGHEKTAEKLFELDTMVTEAVDKLKERGLVSPYLRAFVVARINPLRWIKDEPPPLAEVLKTMRDRAAKFNADKVNQQDLARSGGVPDETG
ncbi:ParB family chromosome partitioning protein [Povalibacter uvarum]|uniref:ParB family chromosome partitioning protein n=1 Tax=Povalibacter uvarum TaxID=732238 RepID=A0A841HG64_9GAMM|nr:ParB N-terminal domain-containing protein [Povalibacter uvarum]MBB6091766.1 ParB family chromosome partitioning protein [Povalibacter uvarum]